ncbi:MAG: beta-N-acetylglucosaminidase, partial [Gemmatimonadales bacterium]|nr:beta-N-acetylglucosaminidase [Gemmatimonadales bacterium]
VVPWVAGTYAAFDDEALSRAAAWVDSLHVGGIIVSVGSPLDIAAKLNHLQRRSRLPLLVAADFESGTAIRLIGGTPFPTNMGVAATGSESDAYDVGRITALEGRAVGVHLTFAPVADVNNNPANPIINVRSFGEDPRRVARLTAAGVRGMQDHGMRATAKHFPGHGDTGTDSHVELPTITAGWPRLDTLELIPFRAAIEAGVTAIMSAHIAIPELDGGRMRPATLSPGILKSVLRDSLGFDGIVVTDALTMGGVVNKYGAGEAVVLSFLAGADLLLQPVDPAVAVGAMEQAVSSGRISHDRLEQSVRRVLALKAELGLFTRRQVSLDSVPVVVGAESFQLTARDVTARSLVLARDEGAAVARLRQGPSAVSLILLADERNVTLGRTLATELRAGGYAVESFVLWPHSGPASYDSARATIARTPTSIFMTAVRPTPWASTIDLPVATAQLIDSTAQQRPTILISLGSPYVVTQTPHVGSFLLGWVARPGTEEAVARALNGTSRLSGTLPISVPPILPLGAGVRLERP